ncbi:MAG: TatD family hydrolase [Alphaproteobacteria bacterium]|nr:TatD family hydrolase [Alphaproteobacteria bacterium]
MLYADSHIHLQDYKTQDVKDIVNTAQKNSVSVFINASAHPSDWAKVAKLADTYSCIVPAFGVHPWHIDDKPENWLKELEQYLKKYPKAWVGECGIDRLKNKDVNAQSEILLPQIELAQTLNRPLIIHAVKSDVMMEFLFGKLPPRTIFHSFTGSVEWGKKIQQSGFYIGLNFSVLRKKNANEIINSLNLAQILLETDGPYQSGMPNTETLPQNLPFLAEKIAQIRQISLTELQNILSENQHRFIGE